MAGGTRSYEMARRLVAAGHEVNMITSWREKDGRRGWFSTVEKGIKVHWLPVPYSNHMNYEERIRAFLRFAWGAALKAASIPADVIFATSTPLTIALPAIYAKRRLKVPMVFEVRDLWPELPIAMGALHGPMIPLARWLESLAYKHSAHIVVLSPGMKQGVLHTGYPDARVHIIPNSADLDLFSVATEDAVNFRQQFHWLKDRPLVVYAGTLGRINGVDYLARLAEKVARLTPDIRFLVVGDGLEREKVRRIAIDLGVYERNFFMLDQLPKKDIPALLKASDLAVSLFVDLPQMWANSANKFFDALAAGTPVAINYEGWQADLLRETGVGIVLDAKNLRNAAYLLVDFLQDKKRVEQAGRKARRLAEERFDRNLLAKKLENVLLCAVEPSGRCQCHGKAFCANGA